MSKKPTPGELEVLRAQAYPDILNDDGIEWKIAKINEQQAEITALRAELEVVKKVGANAITWPAQGGQDLYWLLVARREVVKGNPAAIEKLMLALMEAADFMKQQPGEAQAVKARWLKVPLARLQSGKFPKRYELFLDQALILAMEDEARWMIDNKRTGQTRVPDFLDYFCATPLARIAPKAVSMVIPQSERPVIPGASGTGQEPR